MTLFRNKYKTESNRLQHWDYSSEAIYFITIVSQNRECIFGGIIEGKMTLNDFGKIIEKELFKSVEIRENWIFHNWIVMPNHIHLLVEIVKTDVDSTHGVETHCSASLPKPEPKPESQSRKLSRKPNSISSFVATFKSVTTKQINLLSENNNDESVWQSNYHDHIVRNYDSFRRIFYYIKNNPKNWCGLFSFNLFQ